MGYWRRVWSRAWADALSEFKWNSPVKLAQTFAAPLITLGVTHATTHQWATSALVTLGVSSGLGVLYVFTRIMAVPPQLAAEAESAAAAREADLNREVLGLRVRLESYSGLEPDEGMHAGVAYVANGVWAPTIFDTERSSIEHLAAAVDNIGEKALRQGITVWGRANPTSRHVEIPSQFWEHGRVELQTMVGDLQQHVTTTKVGTFQPPRYHDLRINRRQFEREWTAGS